MSGTSSLARQSGQRRAFHGGSHPAPAPSSFHVLDKNKDGFIEWNEFYLELEKQTQQAFGSLQCDLLERKRLSPDPENALSEEETQAILQPTQTIWTSSILPFLRVGVRVLDSPSGLRLEELYPGTPASAVPGLQVGDTIVGVGDKAVRNEAEFLRAVDATPGDKELILRVSDPRSAQTRAIAIRLRDNEIRAGVLRPLVPTVRRP